MDSYKLFKVEFIFKGKPLSDFVESNLKAVEKCQQIITEEKLKNPELAKQEDSRKVQRTKIIRKHLPAKAPRTFIVPVIETNEAIEHESAKSIAIEI